MRWIFAWGLMMISGHVALSQQHALYSHYIFNLYQINPAYAGARDALSANLSYRAQWVGFEGAPNTQNFSIHGPIRNRNMSLGLMVQNDEIGARKTPSAALTYAYKLNLGDQRFLSFGLQGGIINYQINWTQLEYEVVNDPAAVGSAPNRWIPNFDFGMMYLSPRTYAGISATSLNQQRMEFNGFSDARLNTFINLMAGHVVEISENLSLKPSALVRHALGGPTQFDANVGVLFSNALWLTTTYRYDFGLVFSAHYMVRKKLHVGYSYDYALNPLVAVQSGTHEIFIGYDFNIHRSRSTSPRYF